MYFTVNTAFVNYIDQFNLTQMLTHPILTNKTTSEHTLPIFLNDTKFDGTLLSAPWTLKEYISQCKLMKEIFDLKERYDTMDIEPPNKNFFTNNIIVDISVFTVAIISAIATIIILYLLCKHNKLRTLGSQSCTSTCKRSRHISNRTG